MTWPINSGKEFKGVYNIDNKSLRLFTASTKADDDDVRSRSVICLIACLTKVGERDAAQLREDVELIDGVYGELNANGLPAGKDRPRILWKCRKQFWGKGDA
jgi:peptide chain release factor 3